MVPNCPHMRDDETGKRERDGAIDGYWMVGVNN